MRYVAFLRGVNVGGKNKIKMETLRAVFAAQGFQHVETYINSGNVIFESAKADDKELAAAIESAIEKELELNIKVMARSIGAIDEIVNNNPFEGKFENDKDLHVFFLNEEVPTEKCALLLSQNSEKETYFVRGREIFCLLRVNFSDGQMSKDYIGKKLKISATARNWRTVNKILELSGTSNAKLNHSKVS